jgi:hypothetical protein
MMTDQITEAPAEMGNFDLSSDQVAAMRAQWVSSGLDPIKFDQAAAGIEPAPAAVDLTREEFDAEILSSLKTPSLTERQAQELAASLIAAGVSQDEVNAALKEDGFGQAPPDGRSDEEKAFDKAFGSASPAAYRIDYMGRVPAGVDAAGVAQFNSEATVWLAAIGFPEQIGPAVMERAIDVSQQLGRMSAPAREQWVREQQFDFDRMAGSPERAAELRGFALAALERGGDAFTVAMFDAGSLQDAGVLLHLAHQGERLAFRG